MNPIEDEVVTFTMQRDFGTLPGGATLRFRAAGTEYSRSYLPVRPDGAEVLAVDAPRQARAAARGASAPGSVVLCTYPVEHMAAVTPRVNPEATSSLYDALARHAGVRRPVTVDDPRVACDTLIRDDGTLFAVLAGDAVEPVTVKPALGGRRRRTGQPRRHGRWGERDTRPVRDQGPEGDRGGAGLLRT